MNNRLNLILRITTGVLFSFAVIQIIAGVTPAYRETFPTFTFSLITLLVVTFLPHILKKFNLTMSNGVYYLLIVSILLSVVGGYGFKMYRTVAHYDTLVHFLNGGIITLITFALLKLIINEQTNYVTRIALVAFFISMSTAAFWEIYEFFIDTFLGRNMQRFEDVITGTPLVGQEALHDTMVDMIVHFLGAFISTLLVVRSDRREGSVSQMFSIKKIEAYE